MSNSIYLDTNIIVDIFDDKRVFHTHSFESIKKSILDEDCKIFINSDTMTNLFYILRTHTKLSLNQALEKLEFVKETFDIISIDKEKVSQAIAICKKGLFDDYEDALQYICALSEDCKVIITNNKKDFKNSKIEILNSKEFIEKY